MNPLARLAWLLAWRLRGRFARGVDVGARFPEFRLIDTQGRAHRLSALAGRKTVLWFTNLCEDCRSRAPWLNDLGRRGGTKVAVLAVSILPPDDPGPGLFAASCGFPILIDPEDIVGKRLGLSHPPGACPMNNLFFLDEAGTVSYRSHLSALSEPKFREVCARLLGVAPV